MIFFQDQNIFTQNKGDRLSKNIFDVIHSDQLTHGRLFNYYTVYVHRILLLHSFVSIETVETKECMNILCRIIK